MRHMKLIGKLGWLVSIILSFAMGLADAAKPAADAKAAPAADAKAAK